MNPYRCISCSAVVKKYEAGSILPSDTKWMSLLLPGESTSSFYSPCLCNCCRAEIPRAVLSMFEHYSRMLTWTGNGLVRAGNLLGYQMGGGDEPCESITQREGEPSTDKPNQNGSNSEQGEGGSNAPT